MKFKEYLLNLIKTKRSKIDELQKKSDASQDINEVRAIGETMKTLRDEISEAEKQLEDLDDEGDDGNGEGNGEGEGRSADPQARGFNPVNTYGNMTHVGSFQQGQQAQRDADPYATTEYRQAFKAYVQRGVPIPEKLIQRAGGDEGTTIAADLGMIIPTTIMKEFVKDVQKVYGQIYSKVRKLNVKGGVKFPISKLKANFKWITETTVSPKQKAGDIKDFIEFSYNIGEIRVAQTLLSQVITLDLFEQEIVKIMLEAYVEMMDKMILYGSGEGQPLGICEDPRVENVVEFTAAEFAKWDMWRKKLFAIIPLSKRGQGEFLFPASTVESQLLTMKDNNDRPVFRETTEITVGTDGGKFYGRPVTLVEPDIVTDFDTAEPGEIVGIYWVPNDYAINTNLQFGMKRYFDEDANEWINKGLTIVDGKILDTSGCYLIKKK